MSTERKPGSRGVLNPFSRQRADPAPRLGSEPEPSEQPNPKGSSKTVSPRRAFKRRPRK
jgi:hypothetical protein